MISTENVILNLIKRRVNHLQKNNFYKCTIIDYIDSNIERIHYKISDELLRELFDLRQKVILEKEVK